MFDAAILGVVEGITEFLPVSSTGHMILTMEILKLRMDDFWKSFLIIIQLGSILAVIFIYYKRLLQGIDIYYKLAVAFIPAGVVGFLAYKVLKSLFNGYVVGAMLIIGGLIFIIIEKNYKSHTHKSLDEISFKDAFLIGLGQAVAIIPGTSRSGACIIAGLLCGLKRKDAAQFSFLLAIPTMLAATFYSIYKQPQVFASAHFWPIMLGFLVAFVVALLVIKIFLKIISKVSFVPFGLYRIILGLGFYYCFYQGYLSAGNF